ncbi:MAG: DEAD/DEAH box helicase family protein [Helicobacteraceae bacterium]|jgi:type III restriction enzyme|nr:DEAD/DEAH box helicase family protein [Helicobacteraceae bacterium]
MSGIDKLIINSAFQEPRYHWKYSHQGQTFIKETGRRPAGYFVAGQGSNAYNDIGRFIELPLVNMIRPRVKAWREAGYPGATGVTRRLLAHWSDKEERQYPFFWCQLDAIETFIWLAEAPAADRVGVDIPSDGGAFARICAKLCTGGGKTAVMAMLIVWQICNKATYPRDTRFSKNVFIVAPGLTVKSRLQVLLAGGGYYNLFSVIPVGLNDKLNQGKVIVNNWQALAWDSNEAIKRRKGVDKRGAKSDEAYTREALGEMAHARNLLVINDEAHHAWRKNPEIKVKGKEAKEAEKEATIWIGGLDRIHKTRGILACYDFSATPFAPSGKKNDEEALFGWIVSDFGLNDGIESGLVKTPRVVVRDDNIPSAKTYRSRLYHIYADEEVKDDVNRSAEAEVPLPDLLTQAYYLLGKDWLETFKEWRSLGSPVPPVMITVANRTETAARIKYAFDRKRILIDELCEPKYTIHIDSKTIETAESVITEDLDDENDGARKTGRKEAAVIMRDIVNTVGQKGKRGEQIRNVISVGMLSEGWDAKTVTHILGLRAFSSQLLCEQVVGRGLRRASYDSDDNGMFAPEYVNIFGIPFTFLPHESNETDVPPPKPKTQIEPLPEKSEYEISFPNVIRIDRILKPKLYLDLDNIDRLTLEASHTRLRADLAPIVDGQTDLMKCAEIDLQKLDKELRMQKIVFETAGQIYDLTKASWQSEATKFALIGQVIRLTERYITSDAITIDPPLFNTDPIRRRITLMMNMSKIVQHIWGFIKLEHTESLIPLFDRNRKTRSTGDMATWYTSRPCSAVQRSHISHCVFDSAWEATESYALEKNPNVAAWVKNDHLGFEILYIFDGVARKYYPDFIVKLKNGKTLILETKGQKSRQADAKRKALDEWVAAVNQAGDYDEWLCDTSYNIADVDGIIAKNL